VNVIRVNDELLEVLWENPEDLRAIMRLCELAEGVDASQVTHVFVTFVRQPLDTGDLQRVDLETGTSQDDLPF